MVAGSSYNDTGVKKEDLLPFMVDIGLAPSNTEEPQPLGADGISVALGLYKHIRLPHTCSHKSP